MNRRRFLAWGAGTGAAFALPLPASARQYPRLRFHICADLHHDLVPDGIERLSRFVQAASAERSDFVIQMGDFCHPVAANRELIDLWNTIPGPKHHVIGNHDLERRYSREEVCGFLHSVAPYYSFDVAGYHCVILDGNEKSPAAHPASFGYDRSLGAEQLRWLANDLAGTGSHTLIFLHQGLDAADNGVENAVEVRLLLEEANARAGFRKVLAVFSGHHHQDYYNGINGIHYLQINSMSYHWQDGLFVDDVYTAEQKRRYPLLSSIALYRDPLWASVEISPEHGLLVHGRDSAFNGRSPQEMGMPPHQFGYPVAARITSRRIRL